MQDGRSKRLSLIKYEHINKKHGEIWLYQVDVHSTLASVVQVLSTLFKSLLQKILEVQVEIYWCCVTWYRV